MLCSPKTTWLQTPTSPPRDPLLSIGRAPWAVHTRADRVEDHVCWSLALSLSQEDSEDHRRVCALPSQGGSSHTSKTAALHKDSGTTEEWLEAPALQYLTTPSTSSHLTLVVPPRSAWLLLTVLSTHQRSAVASV
jgi:hypothetical protein